MRNPAVRWLHLGSLLALALVIPSGCYVVPVGGVVRTETVVTEAPVPPPPPPTSTTVVETAPVYDAPPVVEAPIVENEVIYVDEYHHRPPHTYIYYPGDEVYYDPISISFFWYDGGRWCSGRHLPSHIRLHEEHRVSFRSDALHPYDVHTRISGRYHSSSHRDGDRHMDGRRSSEAPRTFAPAMTPRTSTRMPAPTRVTTPELRTPPQPRISATPVRPQVAPIQPRISTVPAPSATLRTPVDRARISDPTVQTQVDRTRVSTATVRTQVAPSRIPAASPRPAIVQERRVEERKKVEGRVITQ